MAQIYKTIESHAPNLVIFSVIGNHDKYFGGRKYWRQIFNNHSSKGMIWGPTDFIWYYNFSNFHFIGLNLPWSESNMTRQEKIG